ncbi:hypothetical protein E4T81_12835 [Barnesiella sp. WM24]|nr:hypothetical protein E4T81_12835 [Barnesiella sp. WM24]
MKKSVIRNLLAVGCALFMVLSVNAGNAGYGAVVTGAGQLESEVGDRLFEIDSLSVSGPIDDSDFLTMFRGVTEGRISILNLEHASPESEEIPPEAFQSASGLKKVILPGNLRVIGWNAFKGCSGLATVEIKSELRVIECRAFEGCGSLRSVSLNPGLWAIYEYAFLGCALDSIIVPPSVTQVGDGAFAENNLKKIYLMPSVAPRVVNRIVNTVDVDLDLFHGTTSLDIPAYIPYGADASYREAAGWNVLTNYIETDDFPLEIEQAYPCEVVTVAAGQLGAMLPQVDYAIDSLVVKGPVNEADIHSLWTEAYRRGTIRVIDLKDAKIENGVIPAKAFAKRSDIQYERADVRRLILPGDIVEIGDSAFYGNHSIEQINLPEPLPSLGKACFAGCANFKVGRIVIADGVIEIPDACFSGCPGLTEVILPEELESIGRYGFAETGISHVDLPASVTSVGAWAFGKSRLETIGMSESLVKIGERAFYATRLDNVDFPASLLEIGENAFESTQLKRIEIGDGIVSIGNNAFSGNRLLTEIVFPSSAVAFGTHVFAFCDELKQVTIPEWMTVIPDNMFSHCRNLESATFPAGLKAVGYGVFIYTGLKEINLPDGIEEIGSSAFYATRFETLTLPASINKIGSDSFAPTGKLRYIKSCSPEPPITGSWARPSMMPFDVPVYIPSGSLEAYQKAAVWNQFENYIETDDFSTVGIKSVVENAADGNIEVYDSAGRKVYTGKSESFDTNSLTGGFYIIKQGEATRKIVL